MVDKEEGEDIVRCLILCEERWQGRNKQIINK